MQISNPFRMNDWPIKRFLLVVLAFQLATWGIFGLEALGLQIPLLRQIIPLIYLLYIPGILILRILKLHKLGAIETLLFPVGLSIAFVMFTGLVMNVYPAFDISRPISLIPLVITYSVVVLILCVISWLRDRKYAEPDFVSAGDFLSPPALFLYLLPLSSILGTCLVNGFQNNIILMVLIVIIALVVVSIGFNKFFSKNLYPLAVFSIGLALLFSRSLISMYISGFDIHDEYYLANLVMINGVWDASIPQSYNTMLSIVMLGPITSLASGLTLTWVFKIIYPVLFALAILGMYQTFQRQTDDRIAFFSCFFFMAMYEFYFGESIILRQQIGTLYLAGIVLLLIQAKHLETKRIFLLIIFGAGLTVSHYGLSYIFLVFLIFAWLMLAFLAIPGIRRRINIIYARILSSNDVNRNVKSTSGKKHALNFAFVMLFIVLTFGWYIYVSNNIFIAYVDIGRHIVKSLSEFLNPAYSSGLTMLTATPKPGWLHDVNAFINYATQVFIVIGVLLLLIRHYFMKVEAEFVAFAVFSLTFVFAAVFLPGLSKAVNIARLYHIALIFLAPFLAIGILAVGEAIQRFVKKISWTTHWRLTGALGVYLAIFFLYQTGFIWQLTEGYSDSVSLSQTGIKNYGSLQAKAAYYSGVTSGQDVVGAQWISGNIQNSAELYATYNDIRIHALSSYGMVPVDQVPALTRRLDTLPESAYVFLQSVNVVGNIGIDHPRPGETDYFNMSGLFYLYQDKNKIYANGGSEIYQ